MSFDEEKLVENVDALAELHSRQLKPNAAKGVYIRSVTLSATQMPGIPCRRLSATCPVFWRLVVWCDNTGHPVHTGNRHQTKAPAPL